MASSTTSKHSAFAGKRLPGADRPQSTARKAPVLDTPPATPQKHGHEDGLITGSGKKRKRFKEHVAAEEPYNADEEKGDGSNSSSPSVTAKKRKIDFSQKVNTHTHEPEPSVADRKRMQAEKEPYYRSTQNPNAPCILNTAQASYFNMSHFVAVTPLRLTLQSATYLDYNLSQMKWNWIKTLLNKLRDVTQPPTVSVRGLKETLLHCLREANKPDTADIDLEERIEALEKNLALDMDEREQKVAELQGLVNDWESRWRNEPIYELKVMYNVFEKADLILLRLKTTHGELFVLTTSDNQHWKDFFYWLEQNQAHMRGIQIKRDGYWNGFGVTTGQVSEDAELMAQIPEVAKLLVQNSCVAVWRTWPQSEGRSAHRKR